MTYKDTSKDLVELLVVTTPEQTACARKIVENYHSYVPSFKSVGRRIDWLIYVNRQLVGMIGIGSATYPPCKDVLRYLGISKDSYRESFNSFANNWRFCMCENLPNIGSKILKLLREEAPKEWKLRYGDTLRVLMTFVGGGHNGAVYKADNWAVVGETAGLPKHKAVSMKWDSLSGTNTIAKKFVKPNGENRKIIFIKILPNEKPPRVGKVSLGVLTLLT